MGNEWIDDGDYIYREGDKYMLMRLERLYVLAFSADGAPTNGNQYVEFFDIGNAKARIEGLQSAVDCGDKIAEHRLCTLEY